MDANKEIELDNRHVMGSNEAISFIKRFVSKELPLAGLVKEYIDKTGYWGITYNNNEIIFSFGIRARDFRVTDKDQRPGFVAGKL